MRESGAVTGGRDAPGRQTAVLFAGLAGPADGQFGDKERRLLIDTLRQAVDLSGGRIVIRREGELMALFATPDAAATAAMRMHAHAEALQQRGGFGLRIGFHSGPVKQRGDDIFGDTVNLALQLADQAKSGQIITSESTAASLSPAVQERLRPLGHIEQKGKAHRVLLDELVWRKAPEDRAPSITSAPPVARGALRLQYRKVVIVRRREGDVIEVGREDGCDIVIAGQAASRRHCTIERRNARFFLTDHSTNGTFIAPEKQPEEAVRTATVPLAGRGGIGIGQSCVVASDIVTYATE
ncbi:MAG TPA: adenylate/guanylate cyclase domain-containing protein [Burkholderiales bacterium]